MTARLPRPMASAVALVAPPARPSTNARISSNTPRASVVNPNSFGSWLTNTTTAMPLR